MNFIHWLSKQRQAKAVSDLVVFGATKVCSKRVRTCTHNITQLAVEMFATASCCHRCWRSTMCSSILRHRLFLLVVLSLQMFHVGLSSQTMHNQQVQFTWYNWNIHCMMHIVTNMYQVHTNSNTLLLSSQLTAWYHNCLRQMAPCITIICLLTPYKYSYLLTVRHDLLTVIHGHRCHSHTQHTASTKLM